VWRQAALFYIAEIVLAIEGALGGSVLQGWGG
jgi:hypothetical protein